MKEAILRIAASILEWIVLRSDPDTIAKATHNTEYKLSKLANLMAHYAFTNYELSVHEKNAKRKTVYIKRFEAYRKKFYAYIARE